MKVMKFVGLVLFLPMLFSVFLHAQCAGGSPAISKPSLDPIVVNSTGITGKAPTGPGGSVAVCIDGGAPLPGLIFNPATGIFSVVSPAVKPSQLIVAQYSLGGITSQISAVAQITGPQTVGTLPSLPVPTLTAVAVGDNTVNGSLPKDGSGKIEQGSIQIWIDGKIPLYIDGKTPIPAVPVKSDGSFSVPGIPPVAVGQDIEAQFTSTSTPGVSDASKPAVIGKGSNFVSVLIGGVEQSGYSSLGENTNPFVNIFLEGWPSSTTALWGRVRLLGAPQPSTQGIVSVFSDPTGQLTSQDYTKVGEAVDFVVGPRFHLGNGSNKSEGWSAIADFGATSPLNSQTVTLAYVVPYLGTQECTTLVNRFTVKNGYNPGLTINPVTGTPPANTPCLLGNYSTLAFTNQDRSSFLLKYGAGFRATHKFSCSSLPNAATGNDSCTPSWGALDLTVGQDEAVTRGTFIHSVFKMDGVLPLPTGSASFVYLFGSAYIRLAKNQDNAPLILTPQTISSGSGSTGGVTIPSPSVIVLPLQQPDRDYFRLGVGLNVNQIFCKMFGSTCPSSTTAPAAAKK